MTRPPPDELRLLLPVPSFTMERVDCSAVYIDDRVNSEGWVSRRSSSASAVAFDSPILSDVPQSLRSDVQLLLLVCKKSMFSTTSLVKAQY